MPADTKHSDYKRHAQKWKRSRDVVCGQDAVHDAGETYLPRLKDQDDAAYKAMVMRAGFFNATGRTLEGLVGMVFRKAPVAKVPAAMQGIIDDIDLGGCSLNGLAQEIVEEVIEVGRIGVLVEYPLVAERPANLAQAAQSNLRPYASVYKTECIINWKTARINNVVQPILVVLMECADEKVDEFESKEIPQLRALMLTDAGYIQRLFRKNERGDWVQYGSDIVPIMNGRALQVIPFFAFGKDENSLDVEDAPLQDLVNLNLQHYRVNADYQHGCHFAGLPTPVVSGYQTKENESLYIGSATAWVFPDPNASASYLEFTGQGLGALEKNLDRIEAQMAAVGARMLAPEKTGVEAAQTLAIRSNGENSVLAGVANQVSRGITKMLEFMALWEGVSGEISYQLNTDYMPIGMSAQDLAELVKAWQSSAISFDTLFDNLKRGEIISETRTIEDERDMIAEGAAPSLNNANGQ